MASLTGITFQSPLQRRNYSTATSEQLPNGHLLNLNPRPRDSNRAERQSAVTADSRLAQSRERSNGIEGKTTTRPESKDPNTMPQTSPSGALATKLPIPKSFMSKGKDQWKDKQPYVEDEKEESLRYKPFRKPDTPPSASENTPEKPTEKNREHHWSKIREKLEKDSPLQKGKEKQKEHCQGAYQKIKSFANSPRNEGAKNKPKYGGVNASDTKSPVPGTTGIPSLSNRGQRASGGITRAPAIRQPPKQKKQQQQQQQQRQQKNKQHAALRSKNSPSRQPSDTDNTTDSSAYSQLSTSSVSGHASSNTEWEDRFVVNMPSANDLNPPFLTAQQIVEFQKSMEKVRREGGDMVHPDTCPSPRTTTPEGKLGSTNTPEKTSGRDGPGPEKKANDISPNPPLQPGRYYSPEEIGKKRFSTIWEETPSKAKPSKDPKADSDGSFLGCKEINGPEERNPDDILYFSTTIERPKVIDISAPISRKPRSKARPTDHRVSGALDDNTMAYREWRSLSDNLLNGKRSKPSPKTMCQEPVCQQQGRFQAPSRAPGKDNSQQPDNKDSPKDDEVFMNTATISRAPATADGKTDTKRSFSSQLPHSNSRTTEHSTPTSRVPSKSPPSGPRPGIPRTHEKNDDKQNTPSKSPPNLTKFSINKTREQTERNTDSPRGIRGIMRFPGMGKPSTKQNMRANARQSSMPTPMSKSSSGGGRSISGPPQVASEPSSKSVSPVSSIIPEEQGEIAVEAPGARIVDVEFHGQHLQLEANQNQKAQQTDDTPDSSENNDSKDAAYPLTLSLLFDILILSIAYIQRLSSEALGNEYPQVVMQSVVKMLEHCAHVSRHVSRAFSTYRSTGTWPKTGNGDLRGSLTDIAQAVVYLISLGFVMLIIGRAAGYVVLIGNWVVWLAKPFGWAFGLVARALVP